MHGGEWSARKEREDQGELETAMYFHAGRCQPNVVTWDQVTKRKHTVAGCGQHGACVEGLPGLRLLRHT